MLRRETRRRSGATGATGGAEAVAADAVNVLPRCDEGLRERLAVDGGVQLCNGITLEGARAMKLGGGGRPSSDGRAKAGREGGAAPYGDGVACSVSAALSCDGTGCPSGRTAW